jgi:hypothetical protein
MFPALLPALLTTLALLPAPARAETPLTGAEFEARVEGRTLTYSYAGQPFGTEQYFPNRRVAWAFTDDICVYGRWYEAGEQICFVYEDGPAQQCWLFFDRDGRLAAQFMGDGAGTLLSEVAQSEGPLSCPGPDVGV